MTAGGAGLAPELTLVFDTSLSAGTTVEVPLNGTADCTVDWGDGNTDSYAAAGNRQHTYAAEGTYTVRVTGTVTQFGYGGGSPTANTYNKLTECTSFGEIGITSLYGAFAFASNLTSVPSSLPLQSNVTSMRYAFRSCPSFNSDIGSWDVSTVTNMQSIFASALTFNQKINGWDVSNVTDMTFAFDGALLFNQDITNWDVSNVTNMTRMFFNADSFDQNISVWDFSGLNAESLSRFKEATPGLSTSNYDALLISWSNAANASLIASPQSPHMGGSKFSDPEAVAARDNLIRNYGWSITDSGLEANSALGVEFTTTGASEEVLIPLTGVTSVDIDWGDGTVDSGVTASNPTHTYATAGSYVAKVSGTATGLGIGSEARWQSKVTSCLSFGDIGLTSLVNGFRSVSANVEMPSFIPSNVVNMSFTFLNASSFNQDISSWGVSSVTNMNSVFSGASSFNQNIGGWDVSNVARMTYMFSNADAFDQDISAWDFSGLDDIYDLTNFMQAATGLSSTNYDALLIAWSNAADASTIFSPLSPNMGGSKYSSLAAQLARENLISTHGWTITDGGLAAGAAAGPVLWLDAADTTSITESGGSVSQWDDKSGNSNNAVQGTSSAQPKTNFTTKNGLNVIDFDGNKFFNLPNATIPDGAQTYDIYIVARLNDAVMSNNRTIISQGNNSTNEFVNARIGTSYEVEMSWWNNTLQGVSNDIQNQTWFIYSSSWDGTTRDLHVDGSIIVSDTPGAVKNTSPNNSRIGSEWVTTSSQWIGNISEILIYDSALSTENRQAVEAYLQSKWNL